MDQETDFAGLPIEERWNHVKWQARMSAYEEALALVEKGENLPISVAGASYLSSAASDSNVVAIGVGIRLVTAVANNMENVKQAEVLRKAVLRPMAEKGLLASKPSVKQTTADACLTFVEVASPNGVVQDIMELLGVRQPKLIAASATVLAQVFSQFGSPVADPKPVLSAVPALFANPDKNVRNAGSALSVALCRWVGRPAMEVALKELKPVQLKDLQTQWEKIKPEPPARFTRSQMQQVQQQQQTDDVDASMDIPNDADVTVPGNEGAAFDPWDVAQPSSILDKISPEFETQTSSTKWKERKEALEPVIETLERALPRYVNDNYNQLVDTFSRILAKDSNIICAQLALTGVRCLALGLRGQFAPFAPSVLPAIVERYREKKPTYIEAVGQCLDVISSVVSVKKLIEVLVSEHGIGHRIPTVKLEAAKYLGHLLQISDEALSPADVKLLAPIGIKLLGDTTEPTRKAGAVLLGCLVSISGEQAMRSYISGLDDHRKAKVAEAARSVNVKTTAAVAPKQQPTRPRRQQPQSQAQPQVPQVQTLPQIPAPRRVQPGGGTGGGTGMEPRKVNPAPTNSNIATPSRPRRPMMPSLEDTSMPPPPSIPAAAGGPSTSSTPKVAKRTMNVLTPMQDQHPAYRRRFQSPARGGDSSVDMGSDSIDPSEIARLQSELAISQRSHERTKQLLTEERARNEAQVLEYQQEMGRLRVQLDLMRGDFDDLKRQYNVQSQKLRVLESESLGRQFSTLSLDRGSTTSPTSSTTSSKAERRRSYGLAPPVRPSRVSPTSTEGTYQPSSQGQNSFSQWERAVKMTSDLRRRIEQMRQEHA